MATGALDGEQHVIAAALHLVMALEANNNLTDDVRKLLSDLNIHLSQMVKVNAAEARNLREIEVRLTAAQHTITALHSTHPNIWGSCPLTVVEYLQAVGEIQRSISNLETTPLSTGSRSKELFDRAQDILQTAMSRLQQELLHILVQNKQCFGNEPTTLNPNLPFDELYEEESLDAASQPGSSSTEEAEDDAAADLIHPDVVPQIKSIANAMFSSGYGQEFCQAFTAFWRDALAEYLSLLDVEHLSIEDVVQMEWKHLNSRIKTWRVAIKRIIGMYLTSVKRLFDQILGQHGCISSATFMEASKATLQCLLNFGQAVAIGPHLPEWLFCLLDMYEALVLLIPDVNALFPEQICLYFRGEFHELLIKLGESATIIFKEFGNHIEGSPSRMPCVNGEVTHLTKYVMKYILYVAYYGDTLRSLLQGQNTENLESGGEAQGGFCAVGIHLQTLMLNLEANLDEKSNLYRDSPLKHIFMMNNICYIIQKINSSKKIRPYFGYNWIRSQKVKLKLQERYYERLTWSSILEMLRVDNKSGKAALKARCQEFAAAFEDVYKNQTRWCVPNNQLRAELRISILNTLILAYRLFADAVTKSIGEKHIKYSEHMLEMYILHDLFEGAPKTQPFEKEVNVDALVPCIISS